VKTIREQITAVASGYLGMGDEAERLAAALMNLIEGLPNRGYCEHCGRGDCTPTAAQWDEQRQRAEEAERRAMAYRSLKGMYLRERNAAQKESREAEEIILRLCSAVERVQALPRTPTPNPDAPPLTDDFRRGWETGVLAALAALDDGSEPKEAR
jgi:hypothetical protein